MKTKLKNAFNFCEPSLLRTGMLFGGVILIDQLTKYIVVSKGIFPIFFNRNVAFSLPIPWYLPWLVIGLSFVGYLYLSKSGLANRTHFMKQLQAASWETGSVVLMIGGGVSNLIDRFFNNGSVIDFIDFKFWPVFNLADTFIVCGLLLFLYTSYIKSSRLTKS